MPRSEIHVMTSTTYGKDVIVDMADRMDIPAEKFIAVVPFWSVSGNYNYAGEVWLRPVDNHRFRYHSNGINTQMEFTILCLVTD